MQIEIYSKVGCRYCDKLSMILENHNIPYTKKTLGQDFTREDFLARFGQSTFPRVLINDELVGGYTETAKFLVENKHV